MEWIARAPERRTDPNSVLDGAVSVISLLTHYRTAPPPAGAPWVGRVSRYAWGRDYHNVIGRRLRKLARFLEGAAPGARVVPAVDTKPLLEKEIASRAGLGWIGKNANLILPDEGSFFFLSELVTDLAIRPDDEPTPDRCGKCTACIDACPTQAIVADRVIDARRCISYLTIESKGPVPVELRAGMGDWIFGCDDCQTSCPWNRFSPEVDEPRFRFDEARFGGDGGERGDDGDLSDLLALDDESFRRRFEGSPVRRAGRDGLLRSVCIALGNRGRTEDLRVLERVLREDVSALVRGHAAWAIGRIGGGAAGAILEAAGAGDSEGAADESASRSGTETDAMVLEEIRRASASI